MSRGNVAHSPKVNYGNWTVMVKDTELCEYQKKNELLIAPKLKVTSLSVKLFHGMLM